MYVYCMIHSMTRVLLGGRKRERGSAEGIWWQPTQNTLRDSDWEELAGVGRLGYRTKRRFDVPDI